VPPLGALDPDHLLALAAQPQFGRAEQAIDDVIRSAVAMIDELVLAGGTDHEQRRQLALGDARGELDVDLLPVVEGGNRPPRIALIANPISGKRSVSQISDIVVR
jgi:hypothetical protein